MHDIRKGNCPLCQHHEVVEAIQPDFGHAGVEHASSVTAEPRWVLGGRNPSKQYGLLTMYFCRACGYAQEFVQGPGEVPLEGRYKTRLIEGVKRDAPYR